jgi:hypothetical protein
VSGRGFVVRPGQGDAVWSLGGRFTTKLAGEDADGQLAFIEAVVGGGGEPPLHIHHREHDDLTVPGPDVLGPMGERYGIEVVGPPIRVARGEEPPA